MKAINVPFIKQIINMRVEAENSLLESFFVSYTIIRHFNMHIYSTVSGLCTNVRVVARTMHEQHCYHARAALLDQQCCSAGEINEVYCVGSVQIQIKI